MVVMSTESGKVVANLPIGTGVDATKFEGGNAFASCGEGTLAVVRKSTTGAFEVAQTLKTARVAKTMGIDTTTHKIYLPTADFEDQKPGAAGRPAAKPNTFKILVVSR